MKASTIILSIANLMGILLILLVSASMSHLAIMEERDSYDGIDGITYNCTVGLVTQVIIIVNIVWIIIASLAIYRRRDYKPAAVFAIVSILWAVTIPVSRRLTYLPPIKANKKVEPYPPHENVYPPMVFPPFHATQ
jgi:hypothetical protein